MKIAIVCSKLGFGGAEHVAVMWANGFVNKGYEVILISNLFEDITYPDSMGREFFALVDGSYVLIHDGEEELCGEAYLIKDGTVTGLV